MKIIYRILISIIFVFSLFSLKTSAVNAGWVDGYYKSNGTYVNGYYRSDPNGLKYDNYSWDYGDDLYNDSYYDYGRSSNWYTPSWSWQDDYWTGLNYYNSTQDDWDSYDYSWDW